MNKFTLLIGLLVSSLVFSAKAYALTPTPAAKAISPTVSQTTNENISNQINQLKDKIASRVSELNLVEKRGVIGTVTDVSSSKITLTDNTGSTKQIDVDEITKFSSSLVKGTFGLSDITKGTKISVLGLYNKQTKRILARFVRTSIDPIFVTGAIATTDPKLIMLSLKTTEGKSAKIDVVPTTKISSYTKTGLVSKLTFLSLNIGDRVIVIGYPDKKDTSLTVASRLIVLPDVPKDPNIDIEIPSPTVAPTVALPAARKLPVTTPAVKTPTSTITR